MLKGRDQEKITAGVDHALRRLTDPPRGAAYRRLRRPVAMLTPVRAVAVVWLANLIVAVVTSGWRWWLLPATFLFAVATLFVYVAQYGVPAYLGLTQDGVRQTSHAP